MFPSRVTEQTEKQRGKGTVKHVQKSQKVIKQRSDTKRDLPPTRLLAGFTRRFCGGGLRGAGGRRQEGSVVGSLCPRLGGFFYLHVLMRF